MIYKDFLGWLKELEDRNNNNPAVVAVVDRLYIRFLHPFEDDVFDVIEHAFKALLAANSIIYPPMNPEAMFQHFSLSDNKEEFRTTYLEEEFYSRYLGNTFLKHFQGIITKLDYFRYSNNGVFAKQDIVRLFQNGIPDALHQAKRLENEGFLIPVSTEQPEISSQIINTPQALEDAEAIRKFMLKISKVFGKKLLAASRLVGWPNKDNIVVYYQISIENIGILVTPVMEQLLSNRIEFEHYIPEFFFEVANGMCAGLITEIVRLCGHYLAEEHQIGTEFHGALFATLCLAEDDPTRSLANFFQCSAKTLYNKVLEHVLSNEPNRKKAFKTQNALSNVGITGREYGEIQEAVTDYYFNFYNFHNSLTVYKEKIDDEHKKAFFEAGLQLKNCIQVLVENPHTLNSESLTDLNRLLVDCKSLLEDHLNPEEITASLSYLTSLSTRISGKRSSGWQALGVALLIFGGSALATIGALTIITTVSGVSLLAAIAQAVGLSTLDTTIAGSAFSSLIGITGVTTIAYNREKGLAKSLTKFISSHEGLQPTIADESNLALKDHCLKKLGQANLTRNQHEYRKVLTIIRQWEINEESLEKNIIADFPDITETRKIINYERKQLVDLLLDHLVHTVRKGIYNLFSQHDTLKKRDMKMTCALLETLVTGSPSKYFLNDNQAWLTNDKALQHLIRKYNQSRFAISLNTFVPSSEQLERSLLEI